MNDVELEKAEIVCLLCNPTHSKKFTRVKGDRWAAPKGWRFLSQQGCDVVIVGAAACEKHPVQMIEVEVECYKCSTSKTFLRDKERVYDLPAGWTMFYGPVESKHLPGAILYGHFPCCEQCS